jgi:hypothetical protein
MAQAQATLPLLTGGAVFSSCGSYRYRLDRELGKHGPTVAFVLHNPSTANANSDDPTSRRGIAFARAWGAARLIFVNAWGGIATRPRDLWAMPDPVGPENDEHIVSALDEVVASGGRLIVAWGRINPPRANREAGMARLGRVVHLAEQKHAVPHALGINQDGSPKHPLYVRGDVSPLPWRI